MAIRKPLTEGNTRNAQKPFSQLRPTVPPPAATRSIKMKLIIEYDPIIGESVSDGKVYAWLKDKIVLAETLESPLTVTTSTSLVIEEARALIIEKALSNKDVMFKFRRKELRVDKYGNLENWPSGFCDAFENVLERLIFKKQSKKE